MDGIHDLGGMAGFGPIEVEPNEQVFHQDWESLAYALNAVVIVRLGACRTWGVEIENRPQRGQFLPDLQPTIPKATTCRLRTRLYLMLEVLSNRELTTPVSKRMAALFLGDGDSNAADPHLCPLPEGEGVVQETAIKPVRPPAQSPAPRRCTWCTAHSGHRFSAIDGRRSSSGVRPTRRADGRAQSRRRSG